MDFFVFYVKAVYSAGFVRGIRRFDPPTRHSWSAYWTL